MRVCEKWEAKNRRGDCEDPTNAGEIISREFRAARLLRDIRAKFERRISFDGTIGQSRPLVDDTKNEPLSNERSSGCA